VSSIFFLSPSESDPLIALFFTLPVMELIAETTTLADQSGVGAENLYTLFETFFPAPSILGYGRKMIDNNFKGDGGFTLQGGIKDAT
jgi:3-hydroxyisobutyrate dehydrogenase-like beta-hydroxyacid dehydrogenase